jgi:hypothetical protein
MSISFLGDPVRLLRFAAGQVSCRHSIPVIAQASAVAALDRAGVFLSSHLAGAVAAT